MHKGQLMIMSSGYQGSEIVVYDGGGGEGSQRIRYWKGGDVHVTKPNAFTWIDGSEFNPKDLIPRDFRGCLPEGAYVEMVSSQPRLYQISNPFELAKLPNLIKLPVEEWLTHINPVGKLFTIEGVDPVACKIDCRGNVYLNGVQIGYNKSWNNLTVGLKVSPTGVDFDPAGGVDTMRQTAMKFLLDFSNRYREKMGMPKLELE